MVILRYIFLFSLKINTRWPLQRTVFLAVWVVRIPWGFLGYYLERNYRFGQLCFPACFKFGDFKIFGPQIWSKLQKEIKLPIFEIEENLINLVKLKLLSKSLKIWRIGQLAFFLLLASASKWAREISARDKKKMQERKKKLDNGNCVYNHFNQTVAMNLESSLISKSGEHLLLSSLANTFTGSKNSAFWFLFYMKINRFELAWQALQKKQMDLKTESV